MRFGGSGTVFAAAVLLLAAVACGQEKKATPAGTLSNGPAAATVNGTVISQRMVDVIAKRSSNAGKEDTPDARAKIIDQLALQIVLADEALKKGLDKNPDVIEQMAALRQSVLATAYIEDYIKANPVSDPDVQTAYDRIKASIKGNEYKARQILVAKESEAKDIIAKLKKDPASFEKLAMERSTDLGSKDRGGDLGWLDENRMAPEFAAALAKLEKGKFTEEPVKSDYGYHVVLLEDVKPIEAPPLDEVKVQLTQQIQQQNVRKQMETLKAAAKIEIAGSAPATPATAAVPETPAPSN
jgi:peptidyl-prolyl cis-trans isomerase C